MFWYLLRHTRAGEPVAAYHSYYLCLPLLLAKRLRKFRLVLEVEEIYQDITPLPAPVRWLERRTLAAADACVISTQELAGRLPAGRPAVVVNGVYAAEPPRAEPPFDDGRVHCVYAGTLDPAKGGAAAAVAAAAFLPAGYHVHILGFGSDRQKQALLDQIAQLQPACRCALSYDGVKQGEAYTRFLQRCQIGLCTQIPEGAYLKTSFPSKILGYMANGLRVVSARIPSVERSAVGDLLCYYDAQTPQAIAAAICAAAAQPPAQDPRARLQALDAQARQDLRTMLEGLCTAPRKE